MHYGWIIVGACLVVGVSAYGTYFSFTLFYAHLVDEFGWSHTVVSGAMAVGIVSYGLFSLPMGWSADRFGPRVTVLVGGFLFGGGTALGALVTEAWQLYVLYGIMFGLAGQGSLAAPALANIARWYDEKRGMAVGIASSGQALAGIVWPPIFGYVLLTLGWRDMFFWYGVFALCVMLPVCLVVRRKPPAYVAPEPGTAGASAERQSTTGPVRQPLTSQQIQWALSAAIIGCCVAMSLPLGHLVSHVTDLGHPIGDAVNVLSVMLMAAFVSRAVILGLLSDRVGALRTMFIFSIVQACMLGLFTVVDSLLALYAVAILCGLGYGGLFPIYAVATREHLPIHEVGRRTGTIFLFGAVAMGLGSWMGGYLFDLTGSYTLPFLIGVAINLTNLVIVALLILRIRPPLAFRLA